ncbi:MAG: hypothetical protein QMB98_02410 [Flaviflexus sp.]|uniref:hypothetical protein n=1 Tax=Flaviflexus sp. TaxID=1969482 RepID=UPI00352DF53D
MTGLWARIVGLVAVFGLALVGAVNPATAAPGEWGFEGEISPNTGFLYFANGDIIAFCTGDQQYGPQWVGLPNLVYTDIETINAGEPYTPRASTTTGNTDQTVRGSDTGALAWLAWNGTKAARNTLTTGANKVEVMAHHFAMNGLAVGGNPENQRGAHSSIVNRASVLTERAKLLGGPYTTGNFQMRVDADGRGGTIVGIGAQTGSRAWYPGASYTVSLSGPATFTNGQKTLTGRTAGEPISEEFVSTGSGDVFASIEVTGLPSASIQIMRHPTAQDVFVSTGDSQVSGRTTTHPLVRSFQPQVTSQVATVELEAGAPLIDSLTATAENWISVDGNPVPVNVLVDVYGPFAQPQAETMTDAFSDQYIGTETVTFNGPGTVSTAGEFTADEEGFYFFRARVRPGSQPDEYADFIEAFTSPFWELSETSVVPWQPQITSFARTEVREGTELRIIDEITQSGFPDDHGDFAGITGWDADTATVLHELYFFPDGTEITEGATEGMDPVGSTTTPAVNGEFTLDTADMQVDYMAGDGTYVVVSSYAGDARTQSVRTSDLDENETITHENGRVSTQIGFMNPDDAIDMNTPVPGAEIWDEVVVEGSLPPGAYTEVELYAYTDGEAPVCEAPIWTSDRIEHNGVANTYTTNRYVTSRETTMTYTMVEVTYFADGREYSRGECGEPSETLTTEFKGEVSTRIGWQNEDGVDVDYPVPGADIWDSVTVTGVLPEGAYTEVELYAYEDADAPVCEAPVWTSDRIEHDGRSGTYETNRYTTDKDKELTYTMVEVTYARDGNVISRGECGDTSETLTTSHIPPVEQPPAPPQADSRGGASGDLAFTGANVAGFGIVGLLVAGLGALLIARTRRSKI